MRRQPSLRSLTIHLIALLSLFSALGSSAGAQVVLQGIDPTGAHFQRSFPKGNRVTAVTRGDTIMAVHSVDMNEMVSVIVELEGAPLSIRRAEQPVNARAQQPMLTAYATIERQQALVLSEIRQVEIAVRARAATLEAAPVTPGLRFAYAINGFVLRTRRWLVSEIADVPGVNRVSPDRTVKALASGLLGDRIPEQELDIQARVGATGRGVVISIIDTGIDYRHPALGGGFGPGFKVLGGWDFANFDADPMDDNGHGTHVAGIAAGNDPQYVGMAPDASLLAFKALNVSGSGASSHIIAAIDRSLDPDQNPVTDDRADVINLSLGDSGGDPDDLLSTAVDNAVRSGVVIVAAAGNDGGNGFQSIGSPAAAREAITVGAADANRVVAPFSSRGPSPKLYAIKPDLLAPGVEINSAAISGGYQVLSGTSMAAPYVAGAVALLIELHSTWTPTKIKSALMLTADDTGVDVWTQGSGHVNVVAAAQATTLVEPASLSPGLVDSDPTLWAWGSTLRITNPKSQTVTYSLSVGNLPNGTSATLTPQQVTIPSGGESQVAYELRVDNSILPNSDKWPPSYVGYVNVDSDNHRLTLPIAFLKSPSLELVFSEEPLEVIVFNDATPNARKFVRPGQFVTLMVPEGRYNIFVAFNDQTLTQVIKEDIVVDGGVRFELNKTDATNLVSIRGPAFDGSVLKVNAEIRTITHRNGFVFGYWNVLPDPIEYAIKTTTASNEFVFEYSTAHYDGENTALETYHQGAAGRLLGIDASVDMSFDLADVSSITFDYQVEPEAKELATIDYFSVENKASLGFWASNRLSRPFRRRVFLVDTGINHPYKHDVYQTDGSTWPPPLPLSGDKFLYSSGGVRLTSEQLWFYRMWNVRRPVYTMARTPDPSVNLGVFFPRWSGQTANTGDRIAIGGGRFSPPDLPWGYFLDPFGTVRPRVVPFTVTRDGTLVSEGTLSESEMENSPFYKIVSVPPDRYRVQVRYDGYSVAGVEGEARVDLDFDTANLIDKDPPFLSHLTLVSDGLLAHSIPRMAENEIRSAAGDEVGGVTSLAVNYRLHSSGSWTELPLTPRDSLIVSRLPSTLNAGHYDLRLTAEDDSGNSLGYELSPAFFVYGLAAPDLFTPDDDASGIALTPVLEWAPVTGAVRYHVQVASDSEFASLVLEDSVLAVTSTAMGPLVRGTQYFWRVRAADMFGNGLWSEARQFTTIVAAPAQVALTSPAPNAEGQPSTVAFAWQGTAQATRYHLQLSTVGTFATLVAEDSTLTDPSYTFGPLAYDTRHHWRVRAANAGGVGPWSEARQFTVALGTGSDGTALDLPTVFALHQNFPNPFRSQTSIAFDTPEAAYVVLEVHDLLGRIVGTVLAEHVEAGRHITIWTGGGLPTGLYWVGMKAGNFSSTRGVLLIR